MIAKAGAPSTWENIDWKPIETRVHRLQVRIAKAIRQRRYGEEGKGATMVTHTFIKC